jgi:hypothetical protein
MFICTYIKWLILIFESLENNIIKMLFVMTHCFVLVICIIIIFHIWNDFILVTFSNDISGIHVILLSIMDAIWDENL